ncbi:MAG: tRNA (adenosine(37)-N6)-threonylcarbamoyltransferase complex dimerization subunit type 1 TsaB [Acidimicrobiia bacterium]
MLTLAIDTATAHVGVAFGRDGQVVGQVQLDGGRRHAEELAPAIDFLRTETGIELDTLAFVAVGIGPGLFTGLRVGVTTARTLAQVLDIPVVGLPSPDLVAYPWHATDRRIVTLVDARRREVFAASYWPVPGGLQRDGDYVVTTPQAVADELRARGEPVLVVGDGAVAYADLLGAVEHVELLGSAAAAPSVAALVELASARFAREQFARPETIEPLYLRQSDAEIAWGTR